MPMNRCFAPDGRSFKQVAFKPTRTASLDGTSTNQVSRSAAEERFFPRTAERLKRVLPLKSDGRAHVLCRRRAQLDPVPERDIRNARPLALPVGRSDSRWRPACTRTTWLPPAHSEDPPHVRKGRKHQRAQNTLADCPYTRVNGP